MGLAAIVPEQFLTFRQATKGDESASWVEAINAEMDSLRRNGTWTLVPRRQAKNVLTSWWVFKRKDAISESGEHHTKYKARLVGRGFQQVHGIDYEETFAPVVKFTTQRMFLAIVAMLDLGLHQMDVKTAFLNGDLNEEIFMEQREGFVDPEHAEYVCKLLKALYGLKQANRRWNAKID